MTDAQLQRASRIWAKRLRLSDWNLDIAFANWLPSGVVGQTDISVAEKRARVRILAWGPFTEQFPDAGWNPEHTLVHELGHVLLDPTLGERSVGSVEHYEQAIDVLAGTLLELGRVYTKVKE